MFFFAVAAFQANQVTASQCREIKSRTPSPKQSLNLWWVWPAEYIVIYLVLNSYKGDGKYLYKTHEAFRLPAYRTMSLMFKFSLKTFHGKEQQSTHNVVSKWKDHKFFISTSLTTYSTELKNDPLSLPILELFCFPRWKRSLETSYGKQRFSLKGIGLCKMTSLKSVFDATSLPKLEVISNRESSINDETNFQ